MGSGHHDVRLHSITRKRKEEESVKTGKENMQFGDGVQQQ